MCFGCVYCARPHLQIFFSWMRQGGSWADKFHVKDGQVWLYKHKTYGSPWKFEVQMIFHVNNTWTIQLHTKTSIAHLSLQDYISMLLIQAIHIFIYIYIYIHTNFVLLLWDLSNCGIKPANANEITLCLYSFKYVSFLRGLKQLGVIGTSSRTAYFLRNGKLAEPMQHALQLSADIPTAVWWQPEYEDTLHGPKNSGQTLPRPHWAHGYSQKRASQHCVATFEPNMIQRSSV